MVAEVYHGIHTYVETLFKESLDLGNTSRVVDYHFISLSTALPTCIHCIVNY